MRTCPEIIPFETIEKRILIIRGQKVILDADLAHLYGVQTKVLNQAASAPPCPKFEVPDWSLKETVSVSVS